MIKRVDQLAWTKPHTINMIKTTKIGTVHETSVYGSNYSFVDHIPVSGNRGILCMNVKYWSEVIRIPPRAVSFDNRDYTTLPGRMMWVSKLLTTTRKRTKEQSQQCTAFTLCLWTFWLCHVSVVWPHFRCSSRNADKCHVWPTNTSHPSQLTCPHIILSQAATFTGLHNW